MFFQLYRATQHYSWYDICCEGVDPDTGEYFPGSGEEVTVTYGYALQPRWFQRHDGGQSSRKDGQYTETTVERVTTLPDGCESENQPTLSEWWLQLRQGVFSADRWDWLVRPRRYWIPFRTSTGFVFRSGFQRDLERLYRELLCVLGLVPYRPAFWQRWYRYR